MVPTLVFNKQILTVYLFSARDFVSEHINQRGKREY